MFRRAVESSGVRVTLTVDGRAIEARAGDTVAAALLAAGIFTFRTTPGRGARAALPEGVCFECLVAIDGAGSQQACLTPVSDGMTVETQRGRRVLR